MSSTPAVPGLVPTVSPPNPAPGSAVVDTAAPAGTRVLVATRRRAAPPTTPDVAASCPVGTITIGDTITARNRFGMRIQITVCGFHRSSSGRIEVSGIETGNAHGSRTVYADAVVEIAPRQRPATPL